MTGLLFPALVRLFQRGIEELLHTEWMIIISLTYFVLLDMIQGLYTIDVTKDAVTKVFMAMTAFVISLWIGVSMRPLPLPKEIMRSAAVQLSADFLLKLAWMCFALGMFYFVFMSDFSPTRLIGG